MGCGMGDRGCREGARGLLAAHARQGACVRACRALIACPVWSTHQPEWSMCPCPRLQCSGRRRGRQISTHTDSPPPLAAPAAAAARPEPFRAGVSPALSCNLLQSAMKRWLPAADGRARCAATHPAPGKAGSAALTWRTHEQERLRPAIGREASRPSLLLQTEAPLQGGRQAPAGHGCHFETSLLRVCCSGLLRFTQCGLWGPLAAQAQRGERRGRPTMQGPLGKQ